MNLMDTHHKEKIKQTILPLYALFFDALPNDLGLAFKRISIYLICLITLNHITHMKNTLLFPG